MSGRASPAAGSKAYHWGAATTQEGGGGGREEEDERDGAERDGGEEKGGSRGHQTLQQKGMNHRNTTDAATGFVMWCGSNNKNQCEEINWGHCLCLSAGSSQGGGEASGEAAEGKRGRGKTNENHYQIEGEGKDSRAKAVTHLWMALTAKLTNIKHASGFRETMFISP